MKQGLHLKLGQQLTMTPQLQQAIRLLQLSTLDLQQEIQQALQENPMLEVEEDGGERCGESGETRERLQTTGPSTTPSAAATPANARRQRFEPAMPDDLPVDTQWEDILPSCAPPSRRRWRRGLRLRSRNGAVESLHDHLRWQLNLTRLSEQDRDDCPDPHRRHRRRNGRLTSGIEELLELFPTRTEIEVEEVTAVLHALQQFEPVGVFARDLQECLLLQLRQLPADTPWMDQARILINRHSTS
jgi:RNA polymerase sigma-54 factor